jgi:hypothetical protein
MIENRPLSQLIATVAQKQRGEIAVRLKANMSVA